MANTDIELVDFGHIRIPLKKSRKIKFKRISFTNISARWKNFRLNRLKSKLIADKEKLVDMEFKNSQLIPGVALSRTEQKVLRKTTAIARLESKIKFLETGSYSTEEFINSRAIKLKDIMMKNLAYNRDTLYGVTEEAAEQIISDAPAVTSETQPSAEQQVEKVLSDEQQKIAKEVQRIIAEQKAKPETEEPVKSSAPVMPVGENIPATSTVAPATEHELPQEPVINIVNHEIPTQKPVDRKDIENAINNAMSDIEVKKPIEATPQAEQSVEDIKVSRNGSSAAKVNKFINEDGTYRLKREDIDEDFRITRFDRSALPTDIKPPVNEIKELDIPPFAASQMRKVPDINAPRKAVTPITETRKYNIKPIEMPKIKEEFFADVPQNEPAARDLPMVVPERQVAIQPVQEKYPVQPVEENFTFNSDIQAVLNRASILKSEAAGIEADLKAEQLKEQEIGENYKRTLGELRAFVDNLENHCNQSYQSMLAVRKRNDDISSQIDAMIDVMGQGSPETVRSGARTR